MAPKSRATVNSDIDSSDDEGGVQSLNYQPPAGFTLYKSKSHTSSAFDVDETAKHELWLIRVPEGVSNEDLATMSLNLPTTSSSSSKGPVSLGTLKKKESSTTSSASTTIKYQLQTISPTAGFAGEMLALQPLVPDSSKGGLLVQAPLGIHHHLALVAQPSIPSGAPLAEEILSRPIPQRDQPEGLKMRFKVSGFDTQVPGTKSNGSGKKFAENWAKTLEKRQRDLDEDLLRAEQAAKAMEEQQEQEEQEEQEQGDDAEAAEAENDSEMANAAVEEEEEKEQVQEESSAKKRKVEDMDVEASEEKKNEGVGFVGTKFAESFGIVTDPVDPELTSSDHASWSKYGYRSAFAIEGDFSDMSSYNHGANDDVLHINFGHMKEFARLTLDFAVELGHYRGIEEEGVRDTQDETHLSKSF